MAEKQHSIEPLARDRKLFCFGYGYTASFLSEHLKKFGWKTAGTTTDPEKKVFLKQAGIEAMLYNHNHTINDPYSIFRDVTHVLLSIPPGNDGDPVADIHGLDLAKMPNIEWIGYLSTTAVYGNQDGAWVDEKSTPEPTSRRGSLRLRAEQQWTWLHTNDGLPLHTFRLSGIYGPGRSAIDSVRAGTARRIEKPGHVFNRIHVEDIVQALVASMNSPNAGAIYNLSDDLPSSSNDVVTYACQLIGIDPPPVTLFDQTEMAPIVRSFYKDNKRVKNDRIKKELGVNLLYPDYKSGLKACMDIEDQTAALLRFENNDASTGR